MNLKEVIGEEAAEISARYLDKIDDVYSRIEVSYNTITNEFVLLCERVSDEDWLLEAYVGIDGQATILRNDCGMHDARERFQLLLEDWAAQLGEIYEPAE